MQDVGVEVFRGYSWWARSRPTPKLRGHLTDALGRTHTPDVISSHTLARTVTSNFHPGIRQTYLPRGHQTWAHIDCLRWQHRCAGHRFHVRTAVRNCQLSSMHKGPPRQSEGWPLRPERAERPCQEKPHHDIDVECYFTLPRHPSSHE